MQHFQLCTVELARPSFRMSIPYPETLKKKILASEYFAESQVAVLAEDKKIYTRNYGKCTILSEIIFKTYSS